MHQPPSEHTSIGPSPQYSDKYLHLPSSMFIIGPSILTNQNPNLPPSVLPTDMPIIPPITTPRRYPTQSPSNKPS